MEKKPKVFQNTISKKLNNNRNLSVTKNNEIKQDNNVTKKIDKIFNDRNYIYKANVDIVLKDKIVNKKIIGKIDNYLLTIDNEKILIDDIIDINKEL